MKTTLYNKWQKSQHALLIFEFFLIYPIITCEFHLYVQGLWRKFKNHVNSIITFAHCLYVYMPFNYPWSLLVIVWSLLVPLKIIEISGKTTVLEGSNLHLTCTTLGQPEPNITWTKEKPGNQGNTVVVQEGKVLNITDINRTDAGNYTCTANHGFGKPESQTVYVNVTCEYALKKCLNNVKQRCTFVFFSMSMYCAVYYWISVKPSTSMQGSKLKFLKNHLLTTFSFKKLVTII